MTGLWNSITGFFGDALALLADLFAFTGVAQWGWAIIALTLITRILLLPLNIKQTRSMRKMQEVGPKVKAIQKKYKVDRELMRTNPEKYRMMKQKTNEEVMALYKEEGVNPAGGCLPLVAQMPVFFALFSVLRSRDNVDLVTAPFYFFTSQAEQVNLGTVDAPAFVDGGLGSATSSAGWPGWLLILGMVVTMFITQKQMMGRNSAADPQQQQIQKTMMYVMPVFLAFISFSLPLGVLLYWVTTNIWQLIQQQIMFRDMQIQDDRTPPPPSNRGKGTGKPKPTGGPDTNGRAGDTDRPGDKRDKRKNKRNDDDGGDDAANALAGNHAARKAAQHEDAQAGASGNRKRRRHLPGS